MAKAKHPIIYSFVSQSEIEQYPTDYNPERRQTRKIRFTTDPKSAVPEYEPLKQVKGRVIFGYVTKWNGIPDTEARFWESCNSIPARALLTELREETVAMNWLAFGLHGISKDFRA